MSDNEVIKDLLLNLTDRIVELQDQFGVVREVIGDIYQKFGTTMERIHTIETSQPKEIKEKIEREKRKWDISAIKTRLDGIKLDREERKRRKERERRLRKEKKLVEDWF